MPRVRSSLRSDGWTCPKCGYHPALRNEIFQFTEEPPDAHAGFKPEYFARLAGLRNQISGFARGMSSFNGRSAIIFRTPKVSSRLVAELASCLQGFVKGFRECAWRAAKFLRTALPSPKHVCQMWSCIRWMHDAFLFEREFDVVGAFDVLEHVD